MDTRREFLKKAALLSGAAGMFGALPDAIRKALEIDPAAGSTCFDAEHVVILMQENRSFDHCFGTLQGVRGFNDPRAIRLPGGSPVWMQTNRQGDTYLPFRLNIKDSSATWMGSLPHSWTDQVDARNNGKHDKWLDAKKSGNESYSDLPLTLGYYNRQDIPFYYALADAFTVCDQNFCSSLTGTTPNRLYLWTGTIRATSDGHSRAHVRNEEVDYDAEVNWRTFPEILEEAGVSWKVYQNEISLASLGGEEDDWLGNFTDNPLEWFTQYKVRFAAGYHDHIEKYLPQLPREIEILQQQIASLPGSAEREKAKKELLKKQHLLTMLAEDQKTWTRDKYDLLTPHEKNLHEKAFSTNISDPFYHELTTLQYQDENTTREVNIPKGDVLKQFRDDVANGQLPTVSWIVAPSNFSDHPGSPWYGAWYVSEVMDILTGNEEVWKKTIFILAYDENDGYFDHVPPYIVPHPDDKEAGLVSGGIDTGVEFVRMEQELKYKPAARSRESAIGLGYRVPLLIASPWSRGGNVCSEIYDHTSILQFLEKFATHKTGKKIELPTISKWRRTICGDLTAVFQPYSGQKTKFPDSLNRDLFIKTVHKAKFKQVPSGFRKLSGAEISAIRKDPGASALMPRQEKGIRRSCALPYQLYAAGRLHQDRSTFEISFQAKNQFFGDRSAGSPFNVYARGVLTKGLSGGDIKTRNYAVAAGDNLADKWLLADFENGRYHLDVNGPNGFFRSFRGDRNEPLLEITCDYHQVDNKPDGNIELIIANPDSRLSHTIEIRDHAYRQKVIYKKIPPSGKSLAIIDLSKSFGWYDFSIVAHGYQVYERRFAGRVETGKSSFTDPAMGRMT